MKSTDILRELFTQIAYDIQEICDEYADKQGKPTKTINDFLDDNQD